MAARRLLLDGEREQLSARDRLLVGRRPQQEPLGRPGEHVSGRARVPPDSHRPKREGDRRTQHERDARGT
jgi:hypothetical protein